MPPWSTRPSTLFPYTTPFLSRNLARCRIATARTRAVAFDGARPAHAPDVAPVLRVGPYGQDGGRIDQGGRGRALIGGGLADGCAQTLHKDAPGAVARLPRPATAVAPRHGHGGDRTSVV